MGGGSTDECQRYTAYARSVWSHRNRLTSYIPISDLFLRLTQLERELEDIYKKNWPKEDESELWKAIQLEVQIKQVKSAFNVSQRAHYQSCIFKEKWQRGTATFNFTYGDGKTFLSTETPNTH